MNTKLFPKPLNEQRYYTFKCTIETQLTSPFSHVNPIIKVGQILRIDSLPLGIDFRKSDPRHHALEVDPNSQFLNQLLVRYILESQLETNFVPC